jgi:hypothetical protein
VSSFNPTNTKFGRRERFNSDPNDNKSTGIGFNNTVANDYDSNPNNQSNYQEVVIDLNLINYPLKSKNYFFII